MLSLNPYITMNGQTRAALAFYQACFGGEIVAQQTFAEAGIPAAAGTENNVIHSEFRAPGVHLMLSDGSPECPVQLGSQIAMCLQLDSTSEQDRLFNALADGGTIGQALENTFWGARFGMVTDRFGIQWMLNCQLS